MKEQHEKGEEGRKEKQSTYEEMLQESRRAYLELDE